MNFINGFLFCTSFLKQVSAAKYKSKPGILLNPKTKSGLYSSNAIEESFTKFLFLEKLVNPLSPTSFTEKPSGIAPSHFLVKTLN